MEDEVNRKPGGGELNKMRITERTRELIGLPENII